MKIKKSTVAAAITAGGLFIATGAGALTLPDHAGSKAEDKVPTAIENPPAEAQDNATAVRQDDDHATDADSTDKVADDEATEAKDTESADDESGRPEDTHGAAVSTLATTTELEGRDKGEAIATLAQTNAGDDQADEHSSDAGDDHAADGAENATTHGRSADHTGQDD
jgi:hypothetical protein